MGDNKAAGNCTHSNKNIAYRESGCCNNYFYANGTCKECPKGTFGKNCSIQCPKSMYGQFCATKCDCKENQQCHRVLGCIGIGICNDSVDRICCNNYKLKDGICQACPKGTFDRNCSKECSIGYYGLFCKEKCKCNETECDKALGCLKKDSNTKTIGHIYWIIPVILGILIFILITICRRPQRSKHRHFVDIPTYQPEIPGSAHVEYNEIAEITVAKNGDTVDSKNLVATDLETRTGMIGASDKVQDTGVYHTLNLRVFDYEEPIKHHQLKRSYSDNSSLYFECPTRLMTSTFDTIDMSNCKRGSSLRQTRSNKDYIHESDEQKLSRKIHFVRENKGSNDVDDSEPTFDTFNVKDSTSLEERNMVPQSKLLLTELSSHLLNIQKY